MAFTILTTIDGIPTADFSENDLFQDVDDAVMAAVQFVYDRPEREAQIVRFADGAVVHKVDGASVPGKERFADGTLVEG